MGKNVFISPNGDRWSVQTVGSEKPYRVAETQKEAIRIGRDLAINNKSELIIQGRDGRIREKNTYGNDKFPPKG